MPAPFVLSLVLATAAPGARLSGRVIVAGAPAPRSVGVNVDKKFCGTQRSAADIAVSPEGGLANAVVSLEDPPRGATISRPLETDVRQEGCTFLPHVVLLPPGGAIRFTNSDPIAHQVRLVGTDTSQNAMQTRNVLMSRRFDAPGEFAVRCDIHPWMSAWAVVMRHPFYTVTDANGRFALDVPEGRYKVRIWHELFGVVQGEAVAGKDATFTFTPHQLEPAMAPLARPASVESAPAAAPAITLAQKLHSMQQLRDQGVLSADEYRRIVDLLIAESR
jgi:plastocyanin